MLDLTSIKGDFRNLASALRGIGLNGPLAFDIETYSPDGFPQRFDDPVVNFSIVTPFRGRGVLSLSAIGTWDLEDALLTFLHDLLLGFKGASLLTYNGSRFDLEYVAERGCLHGLDFEGVFASLRHIDVFKVVRRFSFKLPRCDQKTVERHLGILRSINWVSGGTYCGSYMKFLRFGDLEPMLYNIEDSYGCLRVASIISKKLSGEREIINLDD